MDFPGYAVGGLCLGETKVETESLLDAATDVLPLDKPRYVMGMGTPADLIRGVRKGADMFDCVMPTRHARRGNLFTWNGRLSIKNAAHAGSARADRPRLRVLYLPQGIQPGVSQAFVPGGRNAGPTPHDDS